MVQGGRVPGILREAYRTGAQLYTNPPIDPDLALRVSVKGYCKGVFRGSFLGLRDL